MATMTKRERVRAALAGAVVDRPPAAMWGHDYLREWSPADLVAATVEEYRAHDWDFIKLNPRWTFFAEAWGNTYTPPTEQRNPRTTHLSVQSVEDLRRIETRDGESGVFGDHLEALRLLRAQVGPEVDVLQTVFSPLSVVGLLVGHPADTLRLAAEDPAALHRAIAAVTPTLTAYAQASLREGASGIFFAPLVWASRDTCDEDFYREFGRPYDLQLLDAIRACEFTVLHVCRDHNMIDLLLDYPVAALNWADHGAGNPSLAEVRGRTPKALMGGIDQTRLEAMPAAEVSAAVAAAAGVGPGVLVSPGCSIPPGTPQTNRAALSQAVRAL